MTLMSGIRNVLHRRFLIIVIVFSVILTLPAIFSGYMGDDYFFTGGVFPPDAPFGYYNFTKQNIDTEIQQWWTSPNFKMRFFRPLSSLSLHLDFAVLGASPVMAHVHSVLWFVLLLVGGYRIFRRCLDERAARWAMVLFSLSVMHAWSAGWIAARHAVMGGALTIWAADTYLVWRSGGRAKHGVLSAALFIAGLLTSEISLSFVGFVLSHEVIFSDRSRSNRWRSAAPTMGIALVYVVLYKTMGFGTGGSDTYTDPFSQPGDFIRLFFPKTLSLMGAFVLGVPGIMRMAPEMENASMAIGVSALGLLVAGLFLCWQRFTDTQKRTVKWLALMGTLALFPGVAGAVITQGREFVLSGLAVMGILAQILATVFSMEAPLGKRVVPLLVGILIFAGTLVISPLSRIGMGVVLKLHAQVSRQMGASDTGCGKGSHVVVLTGDFEVPIAYAPHLVGTLQGPFFASWNQLAVTRSPVTVTRPSADRLVLSSESAIVNTMLLREKDDPLAVGDVIERRPMRVEIMETADDGQGPTRIGYTFRSPEVVAGLCPLKTENGILKPVTLPAVGQTMTLPYTPYFK